jgi:hypothetical protein
MSKSKREISGRSGFNQALFGLGKFINRRFRGSDNVRDMEEYNPDIRVTVPGSLPSNYKSTEAEQFRKADMYNRTTKGRSDLGTGVDGLMFDPTLKEKEQTYGLKRRAGDLLERFVGQQLMQNQELGYTQALTNQDIAAMAETNRQRLETNLAFDRDSPTRQQERQLKAKYGEALLAEAVAKQASSAAEIGGLGTARRFGSGRIN